MSRIVILRPEPGAGATLARARARGIEAMAIPLFAIAPIHWAVPDAADYDALLLTSANAARHAGPAIEGLRGLPAYCVGEATASAAREAGLTIAGTGAGDAAALIDRVPDGLRLLHLTGVDHRGIDGVRDIAVYASQAIEPPPSLAALEGGVAMVHSPRAGERLAELVTVRHAIAIAAISQAAAQACGTGWRSVKSLAEPKDSTLLALAASLCQDRAA